MSADRSEMNVVMKRESRELIFERVFDAPRELVFKAYSETSHLERWWGPKGWRTTTIQMDFRPGGMWHFCMTSPDENMKPCAKFKYHDIDIPERITYSEAFVNEQGHDVGDIPDRKVTVTFESIEGETRLVMITQFASLESFDAIVEMGMVQGFTENFERLGEHLRSGSMEVHEQGFVITRVFDAPCDVVYHAWSSPEHLAGWWGPNGFTTTIQTFDMRPGGEWKFIMHGPDGTDYPNHIVFIEVVKNTRIVFEHKAPDFLGTATFEEFGEKTRVTYRTHYSSASDFNLMKSYAVPGGQQTIDRLGALVNELKSTFEIDQAF